MARESKGFFRSLSMREALIQGMWATIGMVVISFFYLLAMPAMLQRDDIVGGSIALLVPSSFNGFWAGMRVAAPLGNSIKVGAFVGVWNALLGTIVIVAIPIVIVTSGVRHWPGSPGGIVSVFLYGLVLIGALGGLVGGLLADMWQELSGGDNAKDEKRSLG